MDRRVTGVALGLTVLLSGCARLAGAGPQASAASRSGMGSGVPIRPFVVGADETGKTLMIHIGQQLVVRLGPNFAVPQTDEPSVGHPAGLLAFTSDGTRSGTYTFEGTKLGSGRIWILAPGCQPGPAMGAHPEAVQCPVVGPAAGGSSSDPGMTPARWLFVATVRVMPLGLG
jgi:hypothetical protein